MEEGQTKVWNNEDRIASIFEALRRVPHDQEALGLGFRLSHDPQRCVRCRAYISTLELSGFIRYAEENIPEPEREGESVAT